MKKRFTEARCAKRKPSSQMWPFSSFYVA